MTSSKTLTVFIILITTILMISFEYGFSEETQTVEVEIKYTNGDRADFSDMKLLMYQDLDKTVFLEKQLENNPETIILPKNHRYKVEVYANGMFGDVGYVELNDNPKKLNIDIPLSGGLKFEVYYKDGQTPINDATVILKSHDNIEIRRGTTNDIGETVRYWIQSTVKQEDYYIANVYLEDIFLKSYFPIKLQPGIAINQKIITDIPEVVEDLISINLYIGTKQITSSDGDYQVTLINLEGGNIGTSKINYWGDAQFSNLKSGTYTTKILTNNPLEEKLWPETNIHITGDLNKFNIFRNSENINSTEVTTYNDSPFKSCNCISFRLDDIQDYWLAETQIELIELFAEKNIPLTVGVIGSVIGDDIRITSVLEKNIENIEIANHSWNNDVITTLDKDIQEKYITDTNQNIINEFGVTPTTFIPPENVYDEGIVEILKRNHFTRISSHIEENRHPSIDEDAFYRIPAVAETAKLNKEKGQWTIFERDDIKEKIIQSVNKNGYAVIMMHPQEFSLNDVGEYSIPNQETISELGLLLDDVKKFDSRLIKISQITPTEPVEDVPVEDVPVEDVPVEDVPVEDVPVEDVPVEDVPVEDTCNCVAFRLDDVQDYWLNNVQIKIMDTFIEKNTPLTIGIIANAIGNDQKLDEYIKEKQRGMFEIATKGSGLTSYTSMDLAEQNKNLKESITQIESTIGVKPHILIPPNNKFNSDTLKILEKNNITHISASLTNGDLPPFEFKGQQVYRFPQTTSTGKYNTSTNIFEGISSKQTFNESIQSINNYGFSVITIHPQEFSSVINSTYVNIINEEQLNELKELIEKFNKKGIKIVPIGKIDSNLQVLVPSWIKTNAGWWSNDEIDDKTFVQGIEYLVQEKIITVSETTHTEEKVQTIPSWIKTNAGWWSNDEIDDKTFVQGIEYLVKNGIIAY